MSEPFLAEIVMFGGNFAPRGWALCDGQLLAISQYQALFSLLATTYGGDGRTTFGLPDLRGRFSLHPGSGPGLTTFRLGEKGGVEDITQPPAHTHGFNVPCGDDEANVASPVNAFLAESNTNQYRAAGGSAMGAGTTSSSGVGGGVTVRNPFTCVNYIIALVGVYPSRS